MSTVTEEQRGVTGAAPGPPAQPAQEAASRGSTFETLAVAGFIFGLFSLFVAIFAVGLAGRAVSEAGGGGDDTGGDAASGGVETDEVVMTEFAFDPDELLVPADAVLTLRNDGAVVHNMAVEGVASDMVDAGGEAELDLAGIAPGTYEFICEVPGHAEAGMVGTITIE
jgi:plastocyanin